MLDQISYPPRPDEYTGAAQRAYQEVQTGYNEAMADLHEFTLGPAGFDKPRAFRAFLEVLFWATERYACQARLGALERYATVANEHMDAFEKDES